MNKSANDLANGFVNGFDDGIGSRSVWRNIGRCNSGVRQGELKVMPDEFGATIMDDFEGTGIS